MSSSVGLKATPIDRPAAPSAAISDRLDPPSRACPWLAPVVTTLVAWLVAFIVVTAVLTLFGDELGSLPLALRALVLSGVLVAFMANLVMPGLSAAVARWEAGTRLTRPSAPVRPPKR
jgi:antibiotic biosynthesis monooxygenase (ABM) superfamily enzyme